MMANIRVQPTAAHCLLRFRTAIVLGLTFILGLNAVSVSFNVSHAVPPEPQFMAVSAGSGHTCALTVSGGVKCWGWGFGGQVGSDTQDFVSPPVYVSGLASGVQSIAAGYEHTCALTTAGGVKCWGYRELGVLGADVPYPRNRVPSDVPGLTTGVTAIAAGERHTCAAMTGGGVKCWGYLIGQSGPVDVPGLVTEVVSISAGGYHTCAVTNVGGVKCWGDNGAGQLGDGTTTSSNVPVDVVGIPTGATAVALGGGHSCAILSGGIAKCWGYNSKGQLGIGHYTSSSTPQAVINLPGSVEALAAGGGHTCALVGGTGLKCWGYNEYGQLGDGGTRWSTVPVNVDLADGLAIASGTGHTCAVTSVHGVKCWGANNTGQLGNGVPIYSHLPVNVTGLSAGVASVDGGLYHACSLTVGGAAKCWGSNAQGQLGNSSYNSSSVPTDVVSLSSGVKSVSAGQYFSCAIVAGDGVVCWGDWFGNLTSLAGTVQALSVGATHSCVLVNGGGAKCWGYNSQGQLGNGTNALSGIPVAVSGLSGNVVAISAGGEHTCVVITGSGVKCWGSNGYGELGDGTTAQRSVPVDVTGLSAGVQTVVAGSDHSCALTLSGGVKCWGSNGYGELGNDQVNVPSSVPVDVTGLTSGVEAIAAGDHHMCAILVGGGVKCWGNNGSGQLGTPRGSAGREPVPVEVLGLPGAVTALTGGGNHTCAILAVGGATCWGDRTYGQLGDGLAGFSTSPVDVAFASTSAACPGPSVFTVFPGTIGETYCGVGFSLLEGALRDQSSLPPVTTAVFRWNNSPQRFDFWFKGFPDAFQTLSVVSPGTFYFFQSNDIRSLYNEGGGTGLPPPGTASISPTVEGANGAIWSGADHDMGDLETYPNIQPVTAVFRWHNILQHFDFWFRGFPDSFQTMSEGLERGRYYFFQSPAGHTILMD